MDLGKKKLYLFKQKAQPEMVKSGQWFIDQGYDLMKLVALEKYYVVDKQKKAIVGEIIDEIQLINLTD